MPELEAYITAADQARSDIFAEYRSLSGLDAEAAETAPHVKSFLENIDIFFRNAAKNKLFSERIRNVKSQSSDLDDELLPAYLTTSEMDSYDDALEAIKCCKKIAYLLFISQYEKFRITERTQYGETLRRLEQAFPKVAVKIYTHKKDYCELMMEGSAPIYSKITSPLTNYLRAIQQMLDSQRKIYQCERNLIVFFSNFLNTIVGLEGDVKKSLTSPSALKALAHVLHALRDRGLDIPEIPKSITIEYIGPVRAILNEHMSNLRGEDAMIAEVIGFLEDIIYFSDERNLPNKDGKSQGTDAGIAGMFENLSGKFKEWLTK